MNIKIKIPADINPDNDQISLERTVDVRGILSCCWLTANHYVATLNDGIDHWETSYNFTAKTKCDSCTRPVEVHIESTPTDN